MSNYTIVSKGLLYDNDISNSGKLLYLLLNTLAEEVNYVQVSEKELATLQDTTDRTVRNGLTELESRGLIVRYRKSLKEVQTYIIIPYGMKRLITVSNDEEVTLLLQEINLYIDQDIKKSTKSKKVKDKVLSSVTAIDYCKYFSEIAKEKKGIIINFSNPKAISIMKRITKDKSVEENKHLINTFIDIYDNRFRKQGYEYPTIESFGASWIYNIVVEVAKNRPMETEKEAILDIVF